VKPPVTPSIPPLIETPSDECKIVTILGLCVLG
jgi:hypothetical protein